MEIVLKDFGEYLGVQGQNFVIFKAKKALRKVPFHKVKRVMISPGNTISTNALFWLSMFKAEALLISNTGRPLSVMLPLSTDARVKTRVKQYQAYRNEKGVHIAKAILKARITTQINLLEKYGLSYKKVNPNFDRMKIKIKK